MRKLKHRSNYAFTISGLAILELVATITIASIILAGSASFIATAIEIMNQARILKITNNNSQVVLNILKQDLLENKGNININSTNFSNTLSFDRSDPDDILNTKTVNFICNYNTKTLYRQFASQIPEIMLNQIDKCKFIINSNANNVNITIFTKINYIEKQQPYEIYEVINAPSN